MSEPLTLGDVLEDALVALVRCWRPLVVFWLVWAAVSALAWVGAALCFMSFDYTYKLPLPLIVAGLGGWAVWWITTPLVPAALAAWLAPGVGEALRGDAPRAWGGRGMVARAAFVFGGLRVGLTAAGGLPGLWWVAAAGMMPAIMACEGLAEGPALRRALALSRGVRGLIGTGLVVTLLGGVGLCLGAVVLAWVGGAWSVAGYKLMMVAGVGVSSVAWMCLEAALLATFYHRLRSRRDREALEAVFV